MTIDLHRTVIRMQLRRFITLIIFVILVIFSMLMLNSQESYFGLTKYQLALCFAVLYFLSAMIETLRELNYIHYTDDGKVLVLKFFSTGFFNRKKQMIEIPREKFSGYELIDEYKGFRKKIILRQILKSAEVKYPPVSITLMNKQQRELLLLSLNHCLSEKKK